MAGYKAEFDANFRAPADAQRKYNKEKGTNNKAVVSIMLNDISQSLSIPKKLDFIVLSHGIYDKLAKKKLNLDARYLKNMSINQELMLDKYSAKQYLSRNADEIGKMASYICGDNIQPNLETLILCERQTFIEFSNNNKIYRYNSNDLAKDMQENQFLITTILGKINDLTLLNYKLIKLYRLHWDSYLEQQYKTEINQIKFGGQIVVIEQIYNLIDINNNNATQALFNKGIYNNVELTDKEAKESLRKSLVEISKLVSDLMKEHREILRILKTPIDRV
jgi:hypothetical protein